MHSKKRLLCFLAASVAIALFIRAPDKTMAQEKTSTLTYTAEVQGKAIGGAEITLYKVADIVHDSYGNETYASLEPYKEIMGDIQESSLEEDAAYFAEKLSGAAENPYQKEVTDKTGTAYFYEVPDGIYLVKETGKSGTAESYKDFVPSVIRLPEKAGKGSEMRTVHAQVKASPVKETSDTEEKAKRKTKESKKEGPEKPAVRAQASSGSKGSSSKPVKTGDDESGSFYLGLLILSAGVLAIVLKKRGNTHTRNPGMDNNTP